MPIGWERGLYHKGLHMPTAESTFEGVSSPRQDLLARWLDAFLPEVARVGWSREEAERAARRAGITADEQVLAAPHGVDSLLEAFFGRADAAMAAALAGADLASMRVRDRVALGVMAWLDALQPHKGAVRRALGWAMMPWRVPAAMERTWALSDGVWTGIGDTSEDYNRYTKRGLLAAVLPPVVLYWLETAEREKVLTFTQARIDNAMVAGRTAGQVMKAVTGWLPLRRQGGA